MLVSGLQLNTEAQSRKRKRLHYQQHTTIMPEDQARQGVGYSKHFFFYRSPMCHLGTM